MLQLFKLVLYKVLGVAWRLRTILHFEMRVMALFAIGVTTACLTVIVLVDGAVVDVSYVLYLLMLR